MDFLKKVKPEIVLLMRDFVGVSLKSNSEICLLQRVMVGFLQNQRWRFLGNFNIWKFRILNVLHFEGILRRKKTIQKIFGFHFNSEKQTWIITFYMKLMIPNFSRKGRNFKFQICDLCLGMMLLHVISVSYLVSLWAGN